MTKFALETRCPLPHQYPASLWLPDAGCRRKKKSPLVWRGFFHLWRRGKERLKFVYGLRWRAESPAQPRFI